MPRTRQPVEHPERVCEAPDCEVRFTPARSTGRFHTRTCAQRAARARKAAERQTTEDADAGSSAEHGLVKAVRQQLEKAKALDTVNGQLALELAKRAVNQDSNLVAMSKELDARMAAATETASAAGAASGAPTPAPTEDAVGRARRRREEIAAAAAAEAEA